MTRKPRPQEPDRPDQHPRPSTLWELATCDPSELALHEFVVIDDRVFRTWTIGR